MGVFSSPVTRLVAFISAARLGLEFLGRTLRFLGTPCAPPQKLVPS